MFQGDIVSTILLGGQSFVFLAFADVSLYE